MSVVPRVLLVAALRGHPGTAVELHYGGAASHIYFRDGAAFRHPQVTTVTINGGWTILVSQAVARGGILGSSSALALLIAGLAVSLLLGFLVYVLGIGRARAVQWAHEQTGQLRHQALHDSLTGLPNRALTFDRIEQMLARSRRNHIPYAVLFLDLDDFKDINDTLGHHAGDQLLVAVGQRLTAALRESETVGRLGGDEFVLLLEGVSLTTGVELPAERVLDVLGPAFDIAASPLPLSVSASIGIATGEHLTPGELLRDADIALYQAKANGKGCCAVFTESMRVAAQDHRHLSVDLHGALEANQFFLVYQPTFDLETNTLVGVEALLRWQHPERGVVQPNEFIPALEASGLIVPVGAWVLDTACRQGAVWQAEGHRFTIAVNVAAPQLARDRIVDDVQCALGRSGFDPTKLILEMTETTLMSNVDEAIARLRILRAFGVRLAVDDFGTGYSSLAYLREFPIDVLKIDRSFVSEIGASEESSALVEMLVQLGKSLGLEIVAEGIEDDIQRLWLLSQGVDTGQGFLFSRPLEVGAVNRLLEQLGTSFADPKSFSLASSLEALHGQQTLWSGSQSP
jgi:diguanylate cyclase (GGDEF)-like protein